MNWLCSFIKRPTYDYEIFMKKFFIAFSGIVGVASSSSKLLQKIFSTIRWEVPLALVFWILPILMLVEKELLQLKQPVWPMLKLVLVGTKCENIYILTKIKWILTNKWNYRLSMQIIAASTFGFIKPNSMKFSFITFINHFETEIM